MGSPASLSRDNIVTMFERVDFYAEAMQSVVQKLTESSNMPIADLIILTAFVIGALDCQNDAGAEAFDDMRAFWRLKYPTICEAAGRPIPTGEQDRFEILMPRIHDSKKEKN